MYKEIGLTPIILNLPMEQDNMMNPFLPAGFRFHPTDEELIVHYLKKKVTSSSHSIVSIIADINLYKFNPWDLPDKASFGENEWFFYTPRDRKYPNGARPNRATASGYWKATGSDKPILSSKGSQCIGVKKALVFYLGRPPKGTKTNWMMYEYRLPNHSIHSPRLRGSMRLDDWVLCRIRQKSNNIVTKLNHKSSSISSSSSSDIEPFEEKEIMEKINYFNDYGLVPQENEVTDEFGHLNVQEETSGHLDSDGSIKNQIEMASSVKETLATIRRTLSLANVDEQMQFLPDESMFTHF